MHARPVAVLAILATLAGCSGQVTSRSLLSSSTRSSAPAQASTPAPAASAGPNGFTPKPIAWHPCGKFDCGSLDVPLDYSNPAGPTISLGLLRQPALDQTNKIGSLIVNNGGPGASPIEFITQGGVTNQAIHSRFDVIGFDPRGVGTSSPLNCATATQSAFHRLDPSPDNAAEQQALDAGAQAIAADCAANAGNLLPHVGSDDVVRDMDTIRAALGEAKLTYLGYSYGTLLGLRYAELFPGNLRAMTLDGVVDPTQDLVAFLRAQTVAFDHLVSQALGDAAADYDTLAARVETDPLPVGARTLGPSELATAALNAVYQPSGGTKLRAAVRSALNGDGSQLLAMNDDYENSVSFAAYAAVECTDYAHPVGADAYRAFADELTTLSPRFGGAIANELLACAFWPAPVHSVAGVVRAAGAPPILVIGTTGDPATPYEQAVKVASELERAVLLTVDSNGHTSFSNTCAQAATGRYLVDLTLPAPGARC